MLYFENKQPTDNYTQQGRKKRSRSKTIEKNIHTDYMITKYGLPVTEPSIMNIVDGLIQNRLMLNQVCSIDSFPMRHSATFVTGTNKWREKAGYRGKFNARGPYGLLLWKPR